MFAVEAGCQDSAKKVMVLHMTKLISPLFGCFLLTGICHDILQKFFNLGNCVYLFEKNTLCWLNQHVQFIYRKYDLKKVFFVTDTVAI